MAATSICSDSIESHTGVSGHIGTGGAHHQPRTRPRRVPWLFSCGLVFWALAGAARMRVPSLSPFCDTSLDVGKRLESGFHPLTPVGVDSRCFGRWGHLGGRWIRSDSPRDNPDELSS